MIIELDEEHRMLRDNIRSNNHSMKPMSAEDAALALAGSEQSFVVFRDAASQRINVLYRRKDGHLGLIDPGE